MADAEAQLYRRIKELRARARGAEPHIAGGSGDPRRRLAARARSANAARARREPRRRAQGHRRIARAEPSGPRRARRRARAGHPRQRPAIGRAARSAFSNSPAGSTRSTATFWPSGWAGSRTSSSSSSCCRPASPPYARTLPTCARTSGRLAGGVESVVTKLDQPIQVTLERQQRQTGVRDLFRPTERAGAMTAPSIGLQALPPADFATILQAGGVAADGHDVALNVPPLADRVETVVTDESGSLTVRGNHLRTAATALHRRCARSANTSSSCCVSAASALRAT